MASKGSIARPGTSKGSLSHLLLQKLASNGSEQSLASRAQPRRRKAILEYALKHGSKRDQLSFNYVAWKTNLEFNHIIGDVRIPCAIVSLHRPLQL